MGLVWRGKMKVFLSKDDDLAEKEEEEKNNVKNGPIKSALE